MTDGWIVKLEEGNEVEVPVKIREFLHVGVGDRIDFNKAAPGVIVVKKSDPNEF